MVIPAESKPSDRISRVLALVGTPACGYRRHRRDIIDDPDLAIIRRKREIFLHGYFSHRHGCAPGIGAPTTRKKFWTENFRKNVERDAFVPAELKSSGWKCLVVRECELEDLPRIERIVRRFLDA